MNLFPMLNCVAHLFAREVFSPLSRMVTVAAHENG